VANHRAGKHDASPIDSAGLTSHSSQRPTAAGKRKVVKPSRPVRTGHVAGRKNLFPALPSTPTAVGAAALVIAAAGAITIGQQGTPAPAASGNVQKLSAQATVFTGSSRIESTDSSDSREQAVSRDSQREALQDAAAEELQVAAEAQAKERNATLQALAASAEQHADEIADEIAANRWVLPLASYDLTAGFGQSSSLWSSTHTGLDFAAPSGSPIVAVASGTVSSTEYDSSYGNKTVITLDDGTEIWYCHQTSFAVSPGEAVTAGQTIGSVGSTGNSTGPHLHLEVRPGAGDPVDPGAALMARGVTP